MSPEDISQIRGNIEKVGIKKPVIQTTTQAGLDGSNIKNLVSIRTAFIVGYPGETEEHFEHLKQFIKDMKFDRMGVFKYSREKGTPSYKMKNKVSVKLANSRYKELMEIQQEISTERNKKFIGKSIPCIIEAYSDTGDVIARTQYDAPEIDGVVNIKTESIVVPGDIEMVKIIDSNEYDLVGEIL